MLPSATTKPSNACSRSCRSVLTFPVCLAGLAEAEVRHGAAVDLEAEVTVEAVMTAAILRVVDTGVDTGVEEVVDLTRRTELGFQRAARRLEGQSRCPLFRPSTSHGSRALSWLGG